MEIIKIEENKENYMHLLYEADPDEEIVKEYLKHGDMYIGIVDGVAVSEIVVTKVNDKECEIKNLATLEECYGRGYASELIRYVVEKYKDKYQKMIVGTTEKMIPFYVLNGFKTYHHTVKNFFIDNYKEEIWDGDFRCIDMYYYSRKLK